MFTKLLFVMSAMLFSNHLGAMVILETAPLGMTNGGTSISPKQFLGARFTLADRYVITEVGGHVKAYENSDRSMFVAVVPTGGPDKLPVSTSLSDAIFARSFLAPYNETVGPYPFQVPETLLSTNFQLEVGDYAVVFGSGLFGATGSGWMPMSGPSQPLSWFFAANFYLGDYFRNLNEQPVRFVVRGVPSSVPEPPTVMLLLNALLALRSRTASTPRRI